jgi:ATP-dependent HslUV protease subunit HslV
MTVIAYRDGVMAADTQAEDGVSKVGGAVKVARGSDGSLYGFAGRMALCCGLARWVEGGCRGERPPMKLGDDSAVVLEVTSAGEIRAWYDEGIEDYPNAEYMAIGSGSGVALGAMFAGADAETAASAGAAHAPGCGGPIMAVRR